MDKILIYDFLFIIMLSVLYKTGKHLRYRWNIFSFAGLVSIAVYTLNEGLRFGRGIDYNAYWKVFDRIASGEANDSMYVNTDIGFYHFCKFISAIGFSWQGCVLTMSLIFIVSSLLFLKSYKDSLRFALPLWVLFSFSQTENVMRWYLGFSLIMIALSFVMQRKGVRFYLLYVVISSLSCTIHWGLIPIALLLLAFTFKKTLVFSPIYAYFGLAIVWLFSQVYSVIDLSFYFNYFASMSNRFIGYTNNTNYWLTKSSSVGNLNNIIGIIDFICSCVILTIGNKCCVNAGKHYVYAYNVFAIAFLLRPLTVQMELLNRYDTLLYIFRAMVYAKILQKMSISKHLKRKVVWEPIMIIIMIINVSQPVLIPFKNNPMKYLYIWDKGNLTPDKMYQIYFTNKQ